METKDWDDLLKALNQVSHLDVNGVFVGEHEYQRSWMKRGGVGAFFTLARCLDRLEALCSKPASNGVPYDIFQHVLDSPDGDTGVLNACRDGRRYLLLVEAELLRRGHKLPLQRHNRKPEDK